MTNRIWQLGLVWSFLALTASPGWAQFGSAMGSIVERGAPTNIDLKDATLGQVVDALLEKSSTAPKEEINPINILISDKLRELKVGTIKLTELYPKAALEAISKLADQSFIIEEVAGGQVLVLRPSSNQVVVKAITLQWMALTKESIASLPREGNLEHIKTQEQNLEETLQEMQKTIDVAFKLHEEVSGQKLSPPQISVQSRLNMVMVVGSPESVEIATEIINASNTTQNFGGMMGGGGGGGFF